ncbi:MAG: IS66 family insertion sequence element accessory protein TnpB [Caulobacterales bacterium]|nr:IS66 family insertion sequence element accessory protein TnpB [Caulobacterales bacterium]
MITLGPRRLWLYGQPVDMRKGIDGLATLVTTYLGREVLTGDVFLFVGRDPSRLKLLCWDRDGFWLATKRLSQGRFQVPRGSDSQGRPSAIELTASEWQLILDGIVVRNRLVLPRLGRGPGG